MPRSAGVSVGPRTPRIASTRPECSAAGCRAPLKNSDLGAWARCRSSQKQRIPRPPLLLLGRARRFALALGRGHLVELLLAHGLRHLLRRAPELALRRVAALGRQGGSGGFLLGLRFCWHGAAPHTMDSPTTAMSTGRSEIPVSGEQCPQRYAVATTAHRIETRMISQSARAAAMAILCLFAGAAQASPQR